VPALGDRLPRPSRSACHAIALAAITFGVLTGTMSASSSGDLQTQIAAGQSAAAALRSQIASDSARIRRTTGGLRAAESQLAGLQRDLSARKTRLVRVQGELLAARDRLVALENRLRLSASALAANLVARYEGQQPDLVSVVLQAHGFSDLLEQLSFLERLGHHDGQVITETRNARAAVSREAVSLAALEARDRTLAEQVLARRNQVAALQAALLGEQIRELHARSADASKLGSLNSHLHSLETQAAQAATQAAATGNANVGGIAVNTGGMVKAPAGAPAAVAEVIAAGNAIATLPYIYGGGHASFHANGYDCSGSVSYALAAAGLVSSPMVSGGFENWGDPGPGRWITIYANAGHVWMEVAGWRFDTVALAESGTRWAQGGGEFSGFVVRHPPGL
jgi:cell wall-associated NlpC family hydrolase